MTLEHYHSIIQDKVDEAHEIAQQARSKGLDPSTEVEIEQAEDLAERCEKLIGVEGLKEKIRDMEDQEMEREDIAFKLAEDFAKGEIGDFETDDEKIDAAVRTAIALLTEGVVAAPIDGIGDIELEENDDGTTFIRIPYYGPIRSAGGTGQALSVLIADYIRQELNLAPFQPRDKEIKRYAEEMELYDGEVGLQYMPKQKETKLIIENCPIMIDGVQTTEKEVGGYRDLERIEGNRGRGGMCLVVGEGIAQKAPKIQKFRDEVGMEGWDWIDKLVKGDSDDNDEEDEENEQEEQTSDADNQDENTENQGEEQKDDDTPEPKPNVQIPDNIDYTQNLQQAQDPFEANVKFLADSLAGRPIISDANTKGGWRLRYGRARNLGLAASGISPASIEAIDQFYTVGSQLKTELPGKAQGAASVTSIQGPTIKLEDGTVKQYNTAQEVQQIQNQIEEIIDVGEMLIPYGEFLENNHDMPPSPYVREWWLQDVQNAGMPTDKLNPDKIEFQQALNISQKLNVPLQPKFTPHWSNITPQQYNTLAKALNTLTESQHENYTHKFTLKNPEIIEWLLLNHKQTNENTIHINQTEKQILTTFCKEQDLTDIDNTLQLVNNTTNIEIRPQVTVRIGNRLGRNEKSARRTMDDKNIRSLFPVGRDPDVERSVQKAANLQDKPNRNFDPNQNNKKDYKGKGRIKTQVASRECPTCHESTYKIRCPQCNTRTEQNTTCSNCGATTTPDQDGEECETCHNGTYRQTEYTTVNIKEEYEQALENTNLHPTQLDRTLAVEGLSSATKIPEPLEKGLLRTKHNVTTFRDGTSRYDMVDLPLTSFTPKEINLTPQQVKNLGYQQDIHGNEITNETQLIELYPQDLILDEKAGDYLLDVANYVDDLLQTFYNMEPFYNAEHREDLIGEIIQGLAPHTSASVTGRILGFANAKANFAHPLYHANKRRNCFHPDTTLNVKINGEWKETTIQNLVETYLDKDVEGYDDSYDDGTIVQDVEQHPEIDEMKVPSMTDEGHRTVENVTHLSKHEAPDHLITVTTEDGSEITITPDHESSVKGTDQLIETKKAHELEEGDLIFDYSTEKVEEVKNYEEIDILEHLLTEDHNIDLERVMIRGLHKDEVYDLLIEEIEPKWDDGQFYKMSSSCEYLDISKTTLDNYLRRESIPVTLFKKLYQNDTDKVLKKVPESCEIGINSDNMNIPRKITLDEELACFIGYYSAEGYCRTEKDTRVEEDTDSLNQVDFAATESEARDFIENVLDKKFNVENPYKNENRFTASGKLLKHFFSEILDAGDGCYEKRIPKQILAASSKIKKQYLSGYISGDGGAVFGGSMLQAYTVSEELKEDIETLISDLQIHVVSKEKDPVLLRDRFPDFYEDDDESMSAKGYEMQISEEDWAYLSETTGFQLSRKNKVDRKYDTKEITEIEHISESLDNVYNMTVSYTHRIQASQGLRHQCDGDEDSVMLLLDGFLNFSEKYLPDRIGRAMDAPMVMTTILDPYEVDDEAHNVDVVGEYPVEFYEGTWALDCPSPKELELPIIEDDLDDPTGIKHTHETDTIAGGPRNSKYAQLDGYGYEEQLAICDKIRAVDAEKVAHAVINKHFLPSLIGNLSSFGRQEFMCTNCYEKYSVPPLDNECRSCGQHGNIKQTIHKESIWSLKENINKILDLGFELPPYSESRLELLDARIESLTEDDTNKQSGLGDFM